MGSLMSLRQIFSLPGRLYNHCKKIGFVASLQDISLPIATLIEQILKISAQFVFLSGSSLKWICDLSDSIDAPMEHGNLGVASLGLGLIYPIATVFDLLSAAYDLKATKKEHEIKKFLLNLMILKKANEEQFQSYIRENIAEDCVNLLAKTENETFVNYQARVRGVIKRRIEQNHAIIARLKSNILYLGNPDAIDKDYAFNRDLVQDWDNHCHKLMKKSLGIIVTTLTCFFAWLFFVVGCFQYSVGIGAASIGVINFTAWIVPNILWLGLPSLAIFTVVKLAIVIYDHVDLVQGRGYDGQEFRESLGEKWDELSWYDKVFRAFKHDRYALLCGYLSVFCKAGLVISALSIGVIISAPVAAIISAALVFSIVAVYFVRYCIIEVAKENNLGNNNELQPFRAPTSQLHITQFTTHSEMQNEEKDKETTKSEKSQSWWSYLSFCS